MNNRIRVLRAEKRWSQAELADRVRVSRNSINAIDSALLAEYGECLNPPLWTPPPATRLAVRDLGRQINRLVHARTQAKNRLHALSAKQGTLKMLLEDEQGFAGGN